MVGEGFIQLCNQNRLKRIFIKLTTKALAFSVIRKRYTYGTLQTIHVYAGAKNYENFLS